MSVIDKIKIGNQVYELGGSGGATTEKNNVRFKSVVGITHVGECYSYTQKNLRETGTQYNCIEYSFDGTEKAVRFSGATTGGSDRLGYCFVDDDLKIGRAHV